MSRMTYEPNRSKASLDKPHRGIAKFYIKCLFPSSREKHLFRIYREIRGKLDCSSRPKTKPIALSREPFEVVCLVKGGNNFLLSSGSCCLVVLSPTLLILLFMFRLNCFHPQNFKSNEINVIGSIFFCLKLSLFRQPEIEFELFYLTRVTSYISRGVNSFKQSEIFKVVVISLDLYFHVCVCERESERYREREFFYFCMAEVLVWHSHFFVYSLFSTNEEVYSLIC